MSFPQIFYSISRFKGHDPAKVMTQLGQCFQPSTCTGEKACAVVWDASGESSSPPKWSVTQAIVALHTFLADPQLCGHHVGDEQLSLPMVEKTCSWGLSNPQTFAHCGSSSPPGGSSASHPHGPHGAGSAVGAGAEM